MYSLPLVPVSTFLDVKLFNTLCCEVAMRFTLSHKVSLEAHTLVRPESVAVQAAFYCGLQDATVDQQHACFLSIC